MMKNKFVVATATSERFYRESKLKKGIFPYFYSHSFIFGLILKNVTVKRGPNRKIIFDFVKFSNN